MLTSRCQAPIGNYHYPAPFQGYGIGVPTQYPPTHSELLRVPVTCVLCGRKAIGYAPYSTCLACSKKSTLPLPLKRGSRVYPGKTRVPREKEGGIYHYGVFVPFFPYVVAQSCKANELASLVRRQCADTPRPDVELYQRFDEWIHEHFNELFPGMERNLGPLDLTKDFHEWNAKFKKSVRTANERAFERLASPCTDEDVRKMLKIKMFLKLEKIDKADWGSFDPLTAPRAISSFSALCNVATGPPVARMQHALHAVWGYVSGVICNSLPSICFPAAMNLDKLSTVFTRAINRFAGGQALENDFTLYDSTHSPESQRVLLRIYERLGIFDDYPLFERVRRGQAGACHGLTRHGWEFIEQSTLKSGQADTCLANTIINVLVHLHILSRLNPTLTLGQILNRTFIAAMGDDNVLYADPEICTAGMGAMFEAYGFIAKQKQVNRPQDVTFLNLWFLEAKPGVYQAVPNFFRLFAKMGYATEEQRNWRAYYDGVVQCFEPAFSFLSIPRRILAHLRKITDVKRKQWDVRSLLKVLAAGEMGTNDSLRIINSFEFARDARYKLWRSERLEDYDQSLADASFMQRLSLACGFTPPAGELENMLLQVEQIRDIPCAISNPLLEQLCAAVSA